MKIGIPKEIKDNENRVGMTPSGVAELIKHGHIVYVQHTAGEGSGFADAQYEQVGAKILPAIEDVYREAEMIVKVKEPISPEYGLIRKGQVLFTYFHFACERELTDAMLKSGATCIAYETVEGRPLAAATHPDERGGWSHGYSECCLLPAEDQGRQGKTHGWSAGSEACTSAGARSRNRG